MTIMQTSTGFFHEKNVRKFQEAYLNKVDIKKQQVAIITTAAKDKEKNLYVKNAILDFQNMGLTNDQISLFDFDKNDILDLEQATIVFISGGNPFYLLEAMKNSGGQNVFKRLDSQGVFFIGVSAGALVLGPSLSIANIFTPQMNITQMKNLRALNLTKQFVFPHYDRTDLLGPDIESKILSFELEYDTNVVRLKDKDSYLIS